MIFQRPLNLNPESSKLQCLQFESQARILNLEAELEREKSQKSIQEYKQQDMKLAESLKKEAEQARKDAERLEKDYANATDERDKAKNELEEMKRMYSALERRMKAGKSLALFIVFYFLKKKHFFHDAVLLLFQKLSVRKKFDTDIEIQYTSIRNSKLPAY